LKLSEQEEERREKKENVQISNPFSSSFSLVSFGMESNIYVESTPLIIQEFDYSTISTTRRVFLVVVASFFIFFTSGVIFGWAPLLLLLREDGVYSELCNISAGDQECSVQKQKLEAIYGYASSVYYISVWPTGAFLDAFGPRWSCMLGSLVFGSGSVLFAFADSKSIVSHEHFHDFVHFFF
jgi:hypothetical protein